MSIERWFLVIGAVGGAIAVGLGAFGTHALRPGLQASGSLDTFETAVRYLFFHALALVAVGLTHARFPAPALIASGWAFTAGMLLFSGSLLGLSLGGWRALGAVAPLGGVGFILGWLLLALGVLRG